MCRKHHFCVKVNTGKGVNTQTFCRNHEARLTVFPCTNTKPVPFQLPTLRWPFMSKQIRNVLSYNTNESCICLHCSVLVALCSYKFQKPLSIFKALNLKVQLSFFEMNSMNSVSQKISNQRVRLGDVLCGKPTAYHIDLSQFRGKICKLTLIHASVFYHIC